MIETKEYLFIEGKQVTFEEMGKVHFTELDKKIVTCRIDSKQVAEYEGKELSDQLDTLLDKVYVVCGAKYPENERLIDHLKKAIHAYLKEFNFGFLTFEELRLGLFLNCTDLLRYPSGDLIDSVNMVGQTMNLQQIGQIFRNYRYSRQILDAKIRNKIQGY